MNIRTSDYSSYPTGKEFFVSKTQDLDGNDTTSKTASKSPKCWDPDYQPSNFSKVFNLFIDRVNPHLDLLRSPIPSREEMLIKNMLPSGTKLTISELQQMDIEEEKILATVQERKLDTHKNQRSSGLLIGSAVQTATMIAGLGGGILAKVCGKSFTFVIQFSLITSTALNALTVLSVNQNISSVEVNQDLGFNRVKRLVSKINKIDLLLAEYISQKLTNSVEKKIEELQYAKLGLSRVVQTYQRIYWNNLKYYDPDCDVD